MKPSGEFKNPFVLYLVKFILTFCILYFGTQVIIGLSAAGGYYSGVVHNYLDYPSGIRSMLLYGSKIVLSVAGYKTNLHDTYFITLNGGRGVKLVYSCLGVGVLSFWTAFVVANKGGIVNKLAWIIGGYLLLCLINIGRIILLLMSINRQWTMPFNMNNHTLFNVVAYAAIFTLIYFFDRFHKRKITVT